MKALLELKDPRGIIARSGWKRGVIG